MLSPSPPRLLHTPPEGPGAFAWRYLDLVDPAGDGVVLIWGWALPFLAPNPNDPATKHPHLNVIAYQKGVPVLYHLEVFDPAEVRIQDRGWRFGPNLLQSYNNGGCWQVHAALDLPIAGSSERILGNIYLKGPVAFGHPAAQGPHQWSILSAVAGASAYFQLPNKKILSFQGRGYHDENHCDRPLSALGIQDWMWGRLAEPDHERVYYRCVGQGPEVALDIRLQSNGQLEYAPIQSWETSGFIGGRWAFTAPRHVGVSSQAIQAGPIVDESMFYLRFGLKSAQGRGWGERVRPAAIQNALMRRLVPICITGATPQHSLLPYFTGTRSDRFQRTFSWWLR